MPNKLIWHTGEDWLLVLGAQWETKGEYFKEQYELTFFQNEEVAFLDARPGKSNIILWFLQGNHIYISNTFN